MTEFKIASYKDIPAVSIKTEKLTALFLPLEGSKLVSLKDNETDTELLAQAQGCRYKSLGLYGSYVDCECSAFDDMFPTIDPYVPLNGTRKGIEYNDHGEVCRLEFSYDIRNSELIMSTCSQRLKYQYDKTVRENQNGGLSI